MTWLDPRALMIARQLREPASKRRYTRRLHDLDPVHGGHRSKEDLELLHRKPRDKVRFPGMGYPVEDLRGERFGLLTVLGYWGHKGGKVMWTCRCDCGQVKPMAGSSLTSGGVRSCGCQRGPGIKRKGGQDGVVQGR